MARKLSISRSWDEAKGILGRDGRLIGAIALALIVLPSTIQTMVTPAAPQGEMPKPGAWMLVAVAAVLVGIVGQLAILRMAIGPATTVREAINHGARRMPVLVAAMLIWVLPIAVVAILLVRGAAPAQPPAGAVLGFLALMILLIYLAVRLIVSAPIASAETAGPVGILKRSWQLTKGNWWRLFGFLALLMVAAIVVLMAAGALMGAIAGILLGGTEPMSVGALLVALVTQTAIAALSVVFLVMSARIYLQLAGADAGEAEASVPSSGT
ncbi:MAG TPA: glycerophosphoryl diester phosphodiesterase membrane domain-containing protein [Sphingomicrobium sp.]|nr:glycerophosphoryl diester phosphodiesterase membrane domain-containing protein [Sphingomicrobium sp.]